MNEEQLINQIKQLKTIKPRNDWISSNKEELLGREMNLTWSMFFKPALAGASVFAVILAFNMSGNALPGEMLFVFEKIGEEVDYVLSSDEERPVKSLAIANERLDELYSIAKENKVEKIPAGIEEFQTEVEDATQELSQVYATNQKVNKKLFEQADKLEKTKKKVEDVFASQIGGEAYSDYEIAMARVKIKAAEDLIEQLRLVELTKKDNLRLDKMEQDLEEARSYLDNENYEPAFGLISGVLEEISNLSKEKQIQL